MAGFGQRLSFAVRGFFALLGGNPLPDDVAREASPQLSQPAAPPAAASTTPAAPQPPAEIPPDRAVQLLALLQRDGRLVDFLTEEIAGYSDAQVGAAVRAVHEGCRAVVERYVTLEPIVASEEGEPVTLEGAVDPASIKLVGNVRAGAPVRGRLLHRGWRAASVNLPPLAEGSGRTVVAPAEVEIP